MATLISDKYEAYKAEVNGRWDRLKANEEELNRIFAEIDDMVGEIPVEVEDKYASVAGVFDTEEEIPESFKGNRYVLTRRDVIVSLISYAVGCMFGRYSLDVDGLVLADAKSTLSDYLAKMPDPDNVTFMPDANGIIPICDEDFFADDITGYFRTFVKAAYGDERLEENLQVRGRRARPQVEAFAARDGAPVLPQRVLLRSLQHVQEVPHLLAVRLGQEERHQSARVPAPLHARHAGADAHRLRACAAGALP